MSQGRSITLLVVGGLALGSVALLAANPARPTTFFSGTVPAQRFHYRDSDDGRRLADIRLEVVERDGQRSVKIVIAAVGPLVEPIPGFTGVRGANRYTAEQLDFIVSGRVPFLVTTQPVGGAAPWVGQWHGGRRGPIPERRLRPDGRIDFLAVSPRAYPLELIVDTGGVGEGQNCTELWCDGLPRLRFTYRVAGVAVQLLKAESLEFDPGATALRNKTAAKLARAAAPPRAQGKPPVTDAQWDACDEEGKWAIFVKIARTDEKRARAFVPFLVRRKEFDFLEKMAVYQPLFEGGIDAAWGLARADAPQWLRVAAWQRQMEIDHGESETSKILLTHNPPQARAWLEKYVQEVILAKGETANPKSQERLHPVLKDLEVLRKRKVQPGALGMALPPLRPAEVFRDLDAPKNLVEFGDRVRAEPGKVYVQQVLRAITLFVRSNRFREPWIGKVLQLTRHPNQDVRQAAYLAFAEIGPVLEPKNSAVEEFRHAMDDRNEPPRLREAALMAFSYLAHPQVFVRLHEVALETDHPGWSAAVSRLNDLGNEFTLQHLNRVDKTKLAPKDAELLEKVRTQLRKWLEDPQRQRVISQSVVETQLERVAWAETTKSPLRQTLIPWTKAFFVQQRDDKFVPFLEQVRDNYTPNISVADRKEWTRLVRGLARYVLATPRQAGK